MNQDEIRYGLRFVFVIGLLQISAYALSGLNASANRCMTIPTEFISRDNPRITLSGNRLVLAYWFYSEN